MENKSDGNKNKKYLEALIVLWMKYTEMVEILTQRLQRYGSNHPLSKLTVDNGFEDLQRRNNPDSSKLTHYTRFSGTRSTINKVYTDIKIANSTKINHIIVSFTGHYNAISIDRLASKSKIGKD